ncbi:hypothetical protein PFTANZ_06339 [Plasmodium falciparum Tanzania (2000708)]|uniref:Uncharacterized protein n=1 Tax=Plasmodium falciparum Tanzania (2000708) TaxID=1036725 RepID=A0A024VWY3_PLAFA|nr:hypothetical protein PFTANZ_06339 [Plasmodium falciparum Tanzania (2000708)]
MAKGGGQVDAAGSSGGDGVEDATAKHMFDRIGQQVHDEIVKNDEAKKYIKELEGKLSLASIWNELASTADTCELVKEYYTKRLGGNSNRYPCGTRKEEVNRFSDKQQAEYDNKKMKCSNGSNGKDEGACASFRRLHLCNKNMENMDTNNNYSKAKHDLLLDVCMAAYYEGDSIKTHYTPHQVTYSDSASQLCTVLARSFADIGDIVRGRDLYGGNIGGLQIGTPCGKQLHVTTTTS